jgi:cytochrome c oxidase subunit 3
MATKTLLRNVNSSKHEHHPFHLLDPSPWPFCLSISLLALVLNFVAWMHGFSTCPYAPIKSLLPLIWSIFSTLLILFWWFSDIITESVYQGHHTRRVIKGLKIGVGLFIASEFMFFFSFFWAFFTYSLSPSMWIGGTWPPVGVTPVSPWGLPLANTLLLLTSGVFITLAHASLILGRRSQVRGALLITLLCAVAFLVFQTLEYLTASVFINDSVYGSIFYLITGFHGFHVLVGTVMIGVSYIRSVGKIMTLHKEAHVGFLCAIWYWHFVDVAWIFVWVFVYVWGGARVSIQG